MSDGKMSVGQISEGQTSAHHSKARHEFLSNIQVTLTHNVMKRSLANMESAWTNLKTKREKKSM